MKTICIAGLKGGIGKTTTTTTLAYLLQAEKEKRVLLIDADCQANATMTYDVEPSDDGIADIMSYALKGDTPDIKSHIITTDYGVDIVPSSTGLQVVNGRLQVEKEHSQIDVLKRALSEIENEYDYCIIDCGLQLDITVLNAICASNLVLSPHKIGGFEEQGSDVLDEILIQLSNTDIGENINLRRFVTLFRKNKTMCKFLAATQDKYDSTLMPSYVRESVQVIKNSMMHGPLPYNFKHCIAVSDVNNVIKALEHDSDAIEIETGQDDADISSQAADVKDSIKSFDALMAEKHGKCDVNIENNIEIETSETDATATDYIASMMNNPTIEQNEEKTENNCEKQEEIRHSLIEYVMIRDNISLLQYIKSRIAMYCEDCLIKLDDEQMSTMSSYLSRDINALAEQYKYDE